MLIENGATFKRAKQKIEKGQIIFGDPDIIAYLRKMELEERKKEARENCDECKGKGFISAVCSECRGTGKVECPDCDGEGGDEATCECQRIEDNNCIRV